MQDVQSCPDGASLCSSQYIRLLPIHMHIAQKSKQALDQETDQWKKKEWSGSCKGWSLPRESAFAWAVLRNLVV
jgi:hypothetical protein